MSAIDRYGCIHNDAQHEDGKQKTEGGEKVTDFNGHPCFSSKREKKYRHENDSLRNEISIPDSAE